MHSRADVSGSTLRTGSTGCWTASVQNVCHPRDARLNRAVTQLDKLHAKHILPGFADRTAEEQTIERLTREITQVRQRDEVPG